jgi:hypothetical protein
MSVDFQRSTRHYIPHENNIRGHFVHKNWCLIYLHRPLCWVPNLRSPMYRRPLCVHARTLRPCAVLFWKVFEKFTAYYRIYLVLQCCSVNEFEVFTAVITNNTILRVVTPWSSVEVHRRFGWRIFHLQGRRVNQVGNEQENGRWRLYVPLKCLWNSVELHGVTTQKIVLFTSSPAILACELSVASFPVTCTNFTIHIDLVFHPYCPRHLCRSNSFAKCLRLVEFHSQPVSELTFVIIPSSYWINEKHIVKHIVSKATTFKSTVTTDTGSETFRDGDPYSVLWEL